MSRHTQKSDLTIKLTNPQDMHPILMQAFYVVPRSIKRDAWWLVDEPDFCMGQTPILPLSNTKKG
jgi:hypothetical protein